MKIKIHNFEQGSEEWFNVRKGKLTASHAQAIATAGKGLETLVNEKLAELFSTAEKEVYENDDLKRGIEMEAQAVSMYEFDTGNEVSSVGFVELNEYVGASPDGMVGESGLVEVKCPNDKNYFKLLMSGEIDYKYIWQMQFQMFVCDRDWVDFIAYNPNYKKSMFLQRVNKSELMQSKIAIGVDIGIEKIKILTEKYKKLIK